MQLLKMELRGFKSFADKTTLTFDKGITAIVGPNGSGKSNISDAVRWVMGEQNVRQLRGQKAEDIIFAGTEKRHPQGVAEVSLYFDNSDHALDLDFSEVAVTRRLFRSGESEFYINKRPCRLKDIHMLFASTGIGQDSMAVIGQNRVDRILNSKPEERRIIFEEVAGISRYKGRKQDGLRKIAETERNLERIQDMMSVLADRMEPLAAQADKVKQFRDLDTERISYEGTLTLQELRNNERLLSKAENYRLAAIAEQRRVEKELAGLEAQRQTVLQAMEKENETLRSLDAQALNAHNELDSMKSRQIAFVQRQETLQENEKELQEETNVLQKKRAQLEELDVSLAAQQKQKEAELQAAEKGLALTNALFGKAEAQAEEAAKALQNVTAANTERQQQLFMRQRDVEELRRRLQENSARYTEVQQTMEQQKAAWHQSDKLWQEQKKACQTLRQDAQDYEMKAATQRKMLQTCEAVMEEAETTYRRLRGVVDALQQRIRVLESMEQEHEGVGRPVKTVLDAHAPWRSHICGIVGEVCQIPIPYATALDVALGAASRYVITETEETAKAAIAYLKERRAGRTTFLPLDTIKGRTRTHDEEQAVNEPGILGFANELITYDVVYQPIFMSLLGKTLIAETMEAGSKTARKYRHRLRIVCLDGTQFNAGGSLTGGSMKAKESSLISRRVLLQELKEKAASQQSQMETAIQTGKTKRHEVETARAAMEAAEEQKQHMTVELQKCTWQMTTAKKEACQQQEAWQAADRQCESLLKVRADIQAELLKKETDLEAITARPQADTDALEAARRKAMEEAEACRKTLTDGQIHTATLREQVHHLEEQRAQQAQQQRQLQEDDNRLALRKQDLQQRQQDTAAMLTELAAKIAAKEQETQTHDTAKEAFYKSREENFTRSQKLETSGKALRNTLQQCGARVHQADVQLEKYHGEIRRYDELLMMQGLTRQEAMERRREGSLKELHEKVQMLKQQIAALGQINPNAEEEYQNAVKQQQFYTTQCDDLRESRTKLEAIVAEIDEAMAKQFRQAFGEIGKHFQQIFSRLFGGGAAHVVLTDTKDILTAGVDIFIQPPGKKQQSLTLLSGGERALTVIALLLAFLAYHPAPFCLVDEVDAALDEANVERMARYLKNYSGNTQFIVITHRRKTMEAANTLQGVTMEERGVSRLLTVKVDELLQKGT